jgi:hypothetical protein
MADEVGEVSAAEHDQQPAPANLRPFPCDPPLLLDIRAVGEAGFVLAQAQPSRAPRR